MTEPKAYLNGKFLPASHATIALFDAGFALGVTVTEQLRTFGGKLFHLQEHLLRLRNSLAVVGLDPAHTDEQFQHIATDLVTHNHKLLAAGDDLGLAIFVTPGPQRSLSAGKRGGPTVGMHTFPLAFDLWADRYARGEILTTTGIQQVPSECWPVDLKCRSRMHYYLADRAAAHIDPGARALLTDRSGFVTETATANLLVYSESRGLLTPPAAKVLPGISLAVTAQLAARLGLPLTETDLRAEDLIAADEVLVTSTPLCLLPVIRVNKQPIASAQPGPIFRQLMQSWNELTGLDVIAQAQTFQSRN